MSSIISAVLAALVILVIMGLIFISAAQYHYMARPAEDVHVTFWQFLKDIF